MQRYSLRLLMALLGVWFGAVPLAWASAEADPWTGKPAPAFEVVDTEGKTLKLADLVGKKVVWLNFWGLRCGPCIKELPILQKFYQNHKDAGLVVIGINADGVDGAFIQAQFAQRDDLKAAGVTFPLAPDPSFAVMDAYGLMGAPLNVLIDKKGLVSYRHEGYEDGDEAKYAPVVQKLLAE